jgi:MFS family permease
MGVASTYRQLLRNGPLARLLIGEFVSSIGDWLYLVALVVLVYRETEDPVLLGIVGAARLLPYVFLSIPAGIIGDRFDRRYVLLVSDLVRAGCMVVLAVLVSIDGPLWSIAAVAILAACFAPFFYPAFGALLPSLVRDEREFGPANSAWATLDNLAWVVGPGIAGLILLAGGIQAAFVINAVSFGVIAVLLLTLPKTIPAVVDSETLAGTDSAGVSAEPRTDDPVPMAPARRFRLFPRGIDLSAVSGVLLLDMLTWFAFGGINILIVILAIDVFDGGDAATGFLSAATGVGGIIGAVASGVLVLRPRLGPAILLGAAAFTASLVLLGLADSLLVAFVAITVASVGHLVLDVVRTTILQRVVPDAFRGRFTGVLMTTSGGAEALGTLVVPIVAVVAGLATVMAFTAVSLLVGAVLAVWLIGRAADVAPGPYDRELRRIARLPIFAGLSGGRVEDALRQLAPVAVAAGDAVIRQGDVADRFYVIVTGRFDVSRAVDPASDPLHLRVLGPNDVFGELGLLRREPRSATVRALEDGLLFSMERDAFLSMVGARSSVSDRLLALYEPEAVPVKG